MSIENDDVIATWSGGKDSSFACYQAMQNGHEVIYLANTISSDYHRVRFHGVTSTLIQAQAEAVGIPLLQAATTPEGYEQQFKNNLRSGLQKNINGIIFGDIHLQDCLEWAKKVSHDLGVGAIEPLWGRDPKEILQDFIDSGFEALVVSTQADLLGEEWVGRRIDQNFLDEITKLNTIDPCGENGEYHTFVTDGPIFKKKLEVTKSQKVFRDGYWFFDIQEYEILDKTI